MQQDCKLGQVTAFVILGLIILILAGLAIFLRSKLMENPIQPPVEKEIQPLTQAIEECIFLTGKEGIVRIGMQGGYIDPQAWLGSPNPMNPTGGKAFYLAPILSAGNPTGQIIIPYWAYLASDSCPPDCQFGSARPGLYRRDGPTSIESQMDRYIAGNAKECILSMEEDFKDRGFEVVETARPSVKTVIGEEDVSVEMTLPMKITLNGKTYAHESFRTDLGINFKRIYDTATAILLRTSNKEVMYFERATIEFIAPFALTADAELPPFAQTVESSLGREHMWIQPEVKKKVKEILADNVNNIQVQGSRNNIMPIVLDDRTKAAFYSNYYFSLDTETEKVDVSDLFIQFSYLPSWDPLVKVNPSKGAIIRPESAKTFFPFPIGIQKYIFSYDISYPIIVQINDPTAFLGKGYTFQYGYEVNIRDSQPVTGDYEILPQPPVTTSFLCDENQRTSGNIKVQSVETISGESMPGVGLSFSCSNEACDLGATTMSGHLAVFDTALPVCMDGRIVPSKEGYFGHARILTTRAGVDDSATVSVEQFRNVTIRLRKMLVGKTPIAIGEGLTVTVWNLLPDRGLFPLTFDEWAVVSLSRIPEQGEDELARTFVVRWNDPDLQTELVTGSYKVEVQLFKDLGPGKALGEVVFPAKDYCDSGFIGTGINEHCTTVGPLRFNDTFVLGSITIPEEYPFNITEIPPDITVIVPAMKLDDINDFEDSRALELATITVSASMDETVRDSLMPRVG